MAQVGPEAQGVVGLDGILALVLELVGLELVQQADAAPLLTHVDQDAAPLVLDDRERLVQLGPAVAPVGAEDVSGQALGVHADQHRVVGLDVAQHQGQRLPLVHRGLVGDDLEFPVLGGHARGGGAADQLLLVDPVLDEGLDRDGLEPELAAEGHELGQARHAAFVVEHLADHPRGREAGQAGQVDRGLGVAGAA